ncbi:MAG: hypothetical protein ABIO67_01265 [Mycobacteriales bacterium]
MNRLLVAAGATALGLALATPAGGALSGVRVGSFYFEDASAGDGKIVVNEGDQITFAFQGNAQHSATVDGLFDSGRKSSPQTYTTGALSRPGTYTLYCTVHGASRHSSTLIVRATATPPPPPPPAPSPSPSSSRSPAASSSPAPSSSPTGGTTPTKATPTTAKGTPTSAKTPSRAGASTVSRGPSPSAAASTTPAALVPTGDGVAGPETLTDLPVMPGSLSDALGRNPAAQGSWTRSVRLALLALLPLLLAAGWALRRRPRDSEQPVA